MKKEIIVLSDIEMGAGNYTDDFISDVSLSQFFLSLCKKKSPIDLVLNGDTFDFLKCPYKFDIKPLYTRYVTEKISVKKLELILQAHPLIFSALKKFASYKKNHIYFILGNHDLDLEFPKIRKKLKKVIGGNVHFPGLTYHKHDVYIEHGQQYDVTTSRDRDKVFLNYKGKKIINYPFAAFLLIHVMIKMKEEHPFFERVRPIPLLFSIHKSLHKKFRRHLFPYLWKSVVYFPFRHYTDPTYTFPRGLFHEFFEHLRSMDWEPFDFISAFKKTKRKAAIIVLGHQHSLYVEKGKKTTILRPGPWRDEYRINKKTKMIVPLKKNYVLIKVHDDDHLEWDMSEYVTKRSSYKFKEVLNHEFDFYKKAQWEEDHQ